MAKNTEHIGERIRERRLGNALSQSELAGLNVSQALVSQWEKGRTVPNAAQITKLDQILGGGVSTTSETATDAEAQAPMAAWVSRGLGKKALTAGELASQADVSIATVYNILSGRAQNPHPRTISSLEKVLGEKFESKNETQEASRIDGIGQLIDFDPYDQKDLPAKPGVYVFYDISGRPIYVGKSGNIAARFKDHEDKFWVRRPIVETAAYVEIPDSATRDQVETVLIQFLKNNAVMNKNKTVRNSN